SARGNPGKAPPHPVPVRLELRERCPRRAQHCDVVVGQVNDGTVEAVCPERTDRAAFTPARAEHEVVDEQLRTPREQFHEGLLPLDGVEHILLLDPDPRQLASPTRELVAATREFLLLLEQSQSSGQMLPGGACLVRGHVRLLSSSRHRAAFLRAIRWPSAPRWIRAPPRSRVWTARLRVRPRWRAARSPRKRRAPA